MAGTLQKNPIWKQYMSDAKKNIANGAGVTAYDSGHIVVNSGSGQLPSTATSGFQQAAAHVLSDTSTKTPGNAIVEVSPNSFRPMQITSIAIQPPSGINPPLGTFVATPLGSQTFKLGQQIAINGATSIDGALLNINTYRCVEVLTGSTTGFTAYCPGIPAFGSAGGGGGSKGDAVHLASLINFVILGASTVVNSGSTVISGGNLGLYPGTSLVGFPPGVVLAPGVEDITNSIALQAQTDLTAAIVYYSGLTFVSLGASSVNLSTSGNGSGANVYIAGNYSAGTSMDIPTTIILDGQGNPNAQFVFKAGSSLTLESGASVNLINGAQAGNVYWVVGSSFVSVFAGTSNMVGNILAHTSVTLGGGTLNGRALANTGAVTMATAVNAFAPGGGGAPIVITETTAFASLKYQGRFAGTSMLGE